MIIQKKKCRTWKMRLKQNWTALPNWGQTIYRTIITPANNVSMYVNEFEPKLQTSDTLFSHSKSQHDQAVYPLQFDAVPGHVKGQDMVNLNEKHVAPSEHGIKPARFLGRNSRPSDNFAQAAPKFGDSQTNMHEHLQQLSSWKMSWCLSPNSVTCYLATVLPK